MKNFLKILAVILLIAGVAGGFGYLFLRIDSIESRILNIENNDGSDTFENVSANKTSDDLPIAGTETCSEKCQKEINEAVLKAVASITPTVKTIVSSPVTAKTNGMTYVPMGSTYTTTSTNWYTIDDSATYIDLINDYGAGAIVSWEASLKVAHGNGQAYARLWDDTNKIAVNGSELTTVNNSTYLLVSSGNLPLWRGRNLYKLQIKSLNSFEVTLTGGKIKISY